MVKHARVAAQAIVEFALAATLIFFLLAATVDLGLIFFAVQGLHNAAQEGATYGSRPVTTGGTTSLDFEGIRDRARHEAGDEGIGFVNLLDLNNDDIPDVYPSGAKQVNPDTGNYVINDYIEIQHLYDSDGDFRVPDDADGDGTPDPCPNLTNGALGCYVQVTVRARHELVFALSPVFGEDIELQSSYVMPIRSSFAQAGEVGATPIIATATSEVPPTPTSQIQAQFLPNNQNRWQVVAYDPAVGTSDGDGIRRVRFSIDGPNGFRHTQNEGAKAYCAFGGNGPCSSRSLAPGVYTITYTVEPTNGESVEFTTTVEVN